MPLFQKISLAIGIAGSLLLIVPMGIFLVPVDPMYQLSVMPLVGLITYYAYELVAHWNNPRYFDE